MNYEELLRDIDNYKDTMTDSERMAAYFKGELVDRIPYKLIGPDVSAPLYGYSIGEFRRSLDVQCEVMDKLESEFGFGGIDVSLGLKAIGEAVGSTLEYPEDGMDFLSEYALDDYAKLDSMEIANPYKDGRLPAMLEKIKYMKKRYPQKSISTGVAGPVTTAAAIRKPENVLRDVIKNKERLHQLIDFGVKSSLAWVEAVCKEVGPVAVSISDPVGSLSLINVKQFEEFSKPYLKELVDGIIKITGKPPTIHICGKTKGIWKHVAEVGVSMWSIDNIEDIEEAKAEIGDMVAISGNVPPVEVMKYGTIDDVINSVKECLIKGSDSPKGYVLYSGCQVPLGTPRENILAFIYAGKKYGRGAQIGKLCQGLDGERLSETSLSEVSLSE
ncbi:uroporphyrinogen decarboxylase family protein [Metaclostridioides mangenotii]|uniref:uroporphyrinogen decarboxylase family protein n=1 Tax=Metaclostridioides mangenotii TaxID=1540 RepID=UPI0004854F6B|nr:uroporphyrinogen decarboxylase family protein [Clostridioides mangenotii]